MDGARRSHYQLTFAVLAVGIGAFALLQSLVIPVLSTVQAELHTSQSAVTWVLTAYLLSASVMTPILGRVGDMFGKKWVFVAALAALAAGSVLAAVAPNLGVMIVARAIQGLGGGTLPLGFGIIRDEFPEEKVAGAVGILAALTAVGGSLGIVLAGPIVDALNWHWLFWLPGIATVIAAAGSVLFVPESPVRGRGTISWLPAVLLSGWLVALLVPLSEASDWGWGSPARPRAVRGGGAACRGLGLVRAAGGHPADRHEDDAPPRGLDEQRGRAAHRRGAVRDVRVPARVRADAAIGRVRVRRQHHPIGSDAAALGGHHVRDRPVRREPHPAVRRQGPGGRGLRRRVRGDGDVRLRALSAVGDLRRHRACWASASGWPSRRCRPTSWPRCRPSRPAWLPA